LNNILKSQLDNNPEFTPELRQQILSSSFDLPKTLTPSQVAAVHNAYASGIRAIFIMFVPLGGLNFVLSLFVEDKGLPDEHAPKQEDGIVDKTDKNTKRTDVISAGEREGGKQPETLLELEGHKGS
jgi:hypothetical protein